MIEARFIDSVHRALSAGVHFQRMTWACQSFAGTPDVYYDGTHSDLWVEYKLIDKVGKTLDTSKLVTALQYKWLARRFAVNENACVVIGVKQPRPAHGIVLETPEQWQSNLDVDWVRANVQSVSQIAAYIGRRVMDEYTPNHRVFHT